MGHAYVKNLSDLVVRQIYAKGKVSVGEMTDFAVKKGEVVHAGEGDHEDRYMLEMIIMEIIDFYLQGHKFTPQSEPASVIEPCDMSPEQEKIYGEWKESGEKFDNWNADEDDPNSEYLIFDSIKWRFAEGWRKRYPDLPCLEYYEN